MNAPDESNIHMIGQSPVSELFVPDALERCERLRAAEDFIYGDSCGYLGEPRMISLSSSNEDYTRFEKFTGNKLFASRTLTSGYVVRAKEGPNSDPHDNFRVCVCLAGSVTIRTKSSEEKVSEGDIYFNYSRNYELYQSEGEYIRIVVPRRLMTGLERAPDMFRIIKSSDPLAKVMRTAVEAHLESYQSSCEESIRLTSDLAVTISQRVLEETLAQTHSSGYEHIRDRAIEYIRDNLHRQDLSVAELTAHAKVSRATLYRPFESVGGIKHFVSMERIAWAKSMLKLGDADRGQISAVAYDTGFVSPEQFSKVFKAHT